MDLYSENTRLSFKKKIKSSLLFCSLINNNLENQQKQTQNICNFFFVVERPDDYRKGYTEAGIIRKGGIFLKTLRKSAEK
ncbi:hypothetical protein Hanom_Chr05g00473601 [Helianthus anomalus]